MIIIEDIKFQEDVDRIIEKYGEEGLQVGPVVIDLEHCAPARTITQRKNGKHLKVGNVRIYHPELE